MLSKLTKNERKYRIKFIQECHYNKVEQRIFDVEVAAMGETYKGIYKSMRSGYVYMFMATITAQRAARAMANVGETGILDILKAYHDCGYEGYIRPDHGRHLWGEGPGNCRPGYGLYDRALGIIPVGQASVNFNGMLSLNESGALLWRALEQGGDRDALADALLAEYEVEREEALADVEAFLTALTKAGCIE